MCAFPAALNALRSRSPSIETTQPLVLIPRIWIRTQRVSSDSLSFTNRSRGGSGGMVGVGGGGTSVLSISQRSI